MKGRDANHIFLEVTAFSDPHEGPRNRHNGSPKGALANGLEQIHERPSPSTDTLRDVWGAGGVLEPTSKNV